MSSTTLCYVCQYHSTYSFLGEMTSSARCASQTTLHTHSTLPQWKPKNVSSVRSSSNFNCYQFILSTVRAVHNNSVAQTDKNNSAALMTQITFTAKMAQNVSAARTACITMDLKQLHRLITQNKPVTWTVHNQHLSRREFDQVPHEQQVINQVLCKSVGTQTAQLSSPSGITAASSATWTGCTRRRTH